MDGSPQCPWFLHRKWGSVLLQHLRTLRYFHIIFYRIIIVKIYFMIWESLFLVASWSMKFLFRKASLGRSRTLPGNFWTFRSFTLNTLPVKFDRCHQFCQWLQRLNEASPLEKICLVLPGCILKRQGCEKIYDNIHGTRYNWDGFIALEQIPSGNPVHAPKVGVHREERIYFPLWKVDSPFLNCSTVTEDFLLATDDIPSK